MMSETGSGHARIVLIDDEPYILEALRRQLRAEPYEVLTYQDPLQALESFAQQDEVAIIVSDNLMPAMRGLELLARAREFAPDVRRVLLTGHTELNDAIDAFNQGTIHRFVNKPWDTQDLLGVLREELEAYRSARALRAAQEGQGSGGPQESARLQETVQELKEALTQVALYEDSNRTRRLNVTPQMRRLSFLVVDGNASVRRLLVNTLQKVGIMGVHAVGSAEEATAFLRNSSAMDVVLSEWNLPALDGMALYEALRNGGTPSSKAIFILMTARENRKAVEFALQAGVDYYLIKPFHLDTLFDQIDRRLRRARRDLPDQRMGWLRKLTVVVSNIDQDSRYKIQQILLINGIQSVTLADSGAKALRVVQERDVDLLILDTNVMDLYWPNLRGQLAELSGARPPPALVVTSVSPLAQEYERIYEAGITAFLPGAIRQRDLLDVIVKALEDDGRADLLGEAPAADAGAT